MSRARAAALLVASGVFLAASTGLAASKPKVLVLPYQHLAKGLPDDLGEQTTVVITKEMAVGGLIVVRADDVADSGSSSSKPATQKDAPLGDPGSGAQAEKLLGQAKDLMEDGDFERAIRHLKKSVRLLEDNGDAVPDLRLLSEGYLQLGVAYFRDGDEDEGDDMLNKAVHFDPERRLDSTDYPPIFIRVFDRARFNVLRRPRAQIEVKATPGSQLLFDGRNLGKTPVLLKEVLPGKHWIRVERPGEPVRVKTIKVRSKRTISVEFEGAEEGGSSSGTPVGVLGAITSNHLSKEHVNQLRGAGRRAGADFVMFGAIYKTDTAYHIHTCYVAVNDGTVGRLVDIAFDLDMLSAEIEVYKLAEDAKKQAMASALSNTINQESFPIAPKFKKRRRRRRAVRPGQKETRLAVVIAAPKPIKPPKSLYAEAPAPAADKKPSRPPKRKTTLLPKDEIAKGADNETGGNGSGSSLTGVTAIVPPPKKNGDDDDNWWIWVVVGVVAAGAAGAGGYFLFSGGDADSGSLEIRW